MTNGLHTDGKLRLQEAPDPESIRSLASPGLPPWAGFKDQDSVSCLACAGLMTYMRKRRGRGLERLGLSL